MKTSLSKKNESANAQSSSSPKALGIALAIALLVGLLFAWPFLGVIGLSALMAYLFYPSFHRTTKFVKNQGLSAAITFVLSILLVAIPLTVVLIVTISQLSSLAVESTSYFNANGSNLPGIMRDTVNNVNTLLAPLNNDANVITDQGIREFFVSSVPTLTRTASTLIIGFVGNIPLAVVLSIMYIILFVEFLINGPKIIKLIYKLSPFEHKPTELYLKRIGLMTNAMVKGQFLISVVISLLSALLMIPLGLGDYFFLLFVVFTIMNLVPLGCGILVIPIAIIAIFLGNVLPGVIVLVAYILISNLDSIIRPKIMPKEAQLSAGLTMIAAFGGIAAFGLLGVIYGPVVMIMVVTTVELYVKNKDLASIR